MARRQYTLGFLSMVALGGCVEDGPDLGLTSTVWAFGFFWDVSNIEWHAFEDHWDLRAIFETNRRDPQSKSVEPENTVELVRGLCEALLANRPHEPKPDIVRDNLFRVSLNFRKFEGGELKEDLQWAPGISFGVVDGRCAVNSTETSLPLVYGDALEGWSFRGFLAQTPTEIEVWNTDAVALFEAVDVRHTAQNSVFERLCRAAIFESKYWRVDGPLADGDRIAIGIENGSDSIKFMPAMIVENQCQLGGH